MKARSALAVLLALAAAGGLAVALAGQRGPGTNIFVADAAIVVNDEIAATTVSVDGELLSVDSWGAGGEDAARLLSKAHNVTFQAVKARAGTNQVVFTGTAELHITARGKHKVFLDKGGHQHIPGFSVAYLLKNGKTLRTRGMMAPTRVTR